MTKELQGLFNLRLLIFEFVCLLLFFFLRQMAYQIIKQEMQSKEFEIHTAYYNDSA